MAKDEIEDEMVKTQMIKGQYGKRTKWSMAEMTRGLTGEGSFGKRTKWSMAEMTEN